MRHGHNEVQKEHDGWGKIHITDGMGDGGASKQEEETVDKDIIETHEGRLRHKGSNKQRTRTGKQELKMTKWT